MNVANIITDSVVDGEGLRTVIFFQGCSIGCKGCHNKSLQDKSKEINIYTPKELVNELLKFNFNKRVTLSGGEPLEQDNCELIEFIHLFKKECTARGCRANIWIYSGRKLEDSDITTPSLKRDVLRECSVMVDGAFILDKKKELLFRGSTNQRIINLRKSFKAKSVVVDKKLQYCDIVDSL